jgi:Tfp pilus assembly protein PilE
MNLLCLVFGWMDGWPRGHGSVSRPHAGFSWIDVSVIWLLHPGRGFTILESCMNVLRLLIVLGLVLQTILIPQWVLLSSKSRSSCATMSIEPAAHTMATVHRTSICAQQTPTTETRSCCNSKTPKPDRNAGCGAARPPVAPSCHAQAQAPPTRCDVNNCCRQSTRKAPEPINRLSSSARSTLIPPALPIGRVPLHIITVNTLRLTTTARGVGRPPPRASLGVWRN